MTTEQTEQKAITKQSSQASQDTVLARGQDYDSILRLGKALAASGYFQDARDANQAVAKILAGRELGIGPIASLTNIYIVKGRITMSANLMASQVKRSGRYDYKVIKSDKMICDLEFFEQGQSVGHSVFTIDDAKQAQLVNGDNWQKYPRNMLYSRAMSNGVKLYCPDVIGGPAYAPDELGVVIDGETGEVIEAPKTVPIPIEARVIEKSTAQRQDARPAPPAPIGQGETPQFRNRGELFTAARNRWQATPQHIFELLGVKKVDEITDFGGAWKKMCQAWDQQPDAKDEIFPPEGGQEAQG